MKTKKTKTATNGRNGKNGYRGVCCRKDLRLAIYLRDSFRCIYCCRDLHGAHPADITLDHVRADSKSETMVIYHAGGTNPAENQPLAAGRRAKPTRRNG